MSVHSPRSRQAAASISRPPLQEAPSSLSPLSLNSSVPCSLFVSSIFYDSQLTSFFQLVIGGCGSVFVAAGLKASGAVFLLLSGVWYAFLFLSFYSSSDSMLQRRCWRPRRRLLRLAPHATPDQRLRCRSAPPRSWRILPLLHIQGRRIPPAVCRSGPWWISRLQLEALVKDKR